mgnify:CR=1 FL=1
MINISALVFSVLNPIIPTYQSVWKPTRTVKTIPNQYAVFTTMTTEAAHDDDGVAAYNHYVYLNLWSRTDPTSMAAAIRSAMYAAGFAMDEESTSDDSYEETSNMYGVHWTWFMQSEEETRSGD